MLYAAMFIVYEGARDKFMICQGFGNVIKSSYLCNNLCSYGRHKHFFFGIFVIFFYDMTAQCVVRGCI
jgi:hypothetical protein